MCKKTSKILAHSLLPQRRAFIKKCVEAVILDPVRREVHIKLDSKVTHGLIISYPSNADILPTFPNNTSIRSNQTGCKNTFLVLCVRHSQFMCLVISLKPKIVASNQSPIIKNRQARSLPIFHSERVGFEPTESVTLHRLSRSAP